MVRGNDFVGGVAPAWATMAVVLLIATMQEGCAPTARSIRVGEEAPRFKGVLADGRRFKLEDLGGKYVLLDFWASWCMPCKAEIPYLKAAWKEFATAPQFAMIGISLDESPLDMREYVRKNGLTWPQAYLGVDEGAKVLVAFGRESIPYMCLIGPTGKVVVEDLRGDDIIRRVRSALTEGKGQ